MANTNAVHYVVEEDYDGWRWLVFVGGKIVARSEHVFSRKATAERSLHRFHGTIRDAESYAVQA